MYDPALSRLIEQALARLNLELASGAPHLARQVKGWLTSLAGGAQPVAYFQHPYAFPALLLPWWLEQQFRSSPRLDLQADMVYSTINGYYYIRLIDNLMDETAPTETRLLPALNFFHSQFQGAYQPYFGADHPFWHFFTATWLHAAEVTYKDAQMASLTLSQFRTVAAQKTCPAKIPLAAVCYYQHQTELLASWAEFCDRFGCWHQLFNDLFDWQSDEQRGGVTYFLSEAERRRRPDESVTGWVLREGFRWGLAQLETWLVDLHKAARKLNSPPLLAYLETRQTMLEQQAQEVAAGLAVIKRLLEAETGR